MGFAEDVETKLTAIEAKQVAAQATADKIATDVANLKKAIENSDTIPASAKEAILAHADKIAAGLDTLQAGLTATDESVPDEPTEPPVEPTEPTV